MRNVDSARLPCVEDGASCGRRMDLIGANIVFIRQAVGPNDDPLEGFMVLRDLGSQIICRVLVVRVRRNQEPQEAHHASLCKRDRFIQVAVPVSRGVHEHVSDGRLQIRSLDCRTDSARGIRDQPARMAEQTFEAEMVSEARGNGIAAEKVLGEFRFAEIQQAGSDHGKA